MPFLMAVLPIGATGAAVRSEVASEMSFKAGCKRLLHLGHVFPDTHISFYRILVSNLNIRFCNVAHQCSGVSSMFNCTVIFQRVFLLEQRYIFRYPPSTYHCPAWSNRRWNSIFSFAFTVQRMPPTLFSVNRKTQSQ